MNPDENALKFRVRAWKELAPFYLDFGETLQCHFLLNDLKWTKAAEETNYDGHGELDLLLSGQMEQNSFLTSLTVLYPEEETPVNYLEMVRNERELISLAATED